MIYYQLLLVTLSTCDHYTTEVCGCILCCCLRRPAMFWELWLVRRQSSACSMAAVQHQQQWDQQQEDHHQQCLGLLQPSLLPWMMQTLKYGQQLLWFCRKLAWG
jgi:hypothetical protein